MTKEHPAAWELRWIKDNVDKYRNERDAREVSLNILKRLSISSSLKYLSQNVFSETLNAEFAHNLKYVVLSEDKTPCTFRSATISLSFYGSLYITAGKEKTMSSIDEFKKSINADWSLVPNSAVLQILEREIIGEFSCSAINHKNSSIVEVKTNVEGIDVWYNIHFASVFNK